MPSVALVTARAARGLDEDQEPLEEALRAAGLQVEIADWDDPDVDWASFDAAVLRSTWDYTDRLGEFLAWVERTAPLTALFNPAAIVRWNTDKHYLSQLAKSGVPTVPGEFVEPGMNVEAALNDFLQKHAAPELVVKPAVGAGSRDAQRHARGSIESTVSHIRRLLEAQRSVLLQPYFDRVDVYGETSLIFFAGRFSHAIRKGPMLADPEERGADDGGAKDRPLEKASATGNGLFLAERISPRIAAADEIAVATRALEAIPFEPTLYARVDLIRDQDDRPVLLELELTEPSLFFAHAEGAAARFAAIIRDRVKR